MRPQGGLRAAEKVLVVGAGAVGQVYGHALARGGARVTYLVKPKHKGEARRGFVLYDLNRGRAPVRWNDFAVVTEPEPGFGLMAYFAPLPGEELPEPGVAFWVPPFGGCPLSGPRAASVASVLRAGGLPAKVQRDVLGARAFGGAVFETFVTALEVAGWDRRALVRDQELVGFACRGAREAATVVERATGARRPAALSALCPFVARVGLDTLARLAPFDVATFFKVHYAKIAEQRRVLAAAERDRARTLGVATPALDALLERRVAA